MVALPALITANRRSSEERPATVAAVAPVGGVTAGGQLSSGASPPTTSPPTTDAPSTTLLAPVATDAMAGAAPPAAVTTSARHAVEGKATFQQYDDALWGPAACSAATIPIGTVVHLTNLNSGLSATCTVRARVEASTGFVLISDDTVFSAIADPVVGIIPVRITW
jgi:hypothetical protein